MEILSYIYIGLHVKYPLFLSGFNEIGIFSTDFWENTQISNFTKIPISNFTKILKYQISRKYSNVKFHENTQISDFTKILKYQISRKYSNIRFYENTQISNFTKIRPVGTVLFHANGQTDMLFINTRPRLKRIKGAC
jgi:hypothetical protein